MESIYNRKYGSFLASDKGYNGFRNRLRLEKFTKVIKPQMKDKTLEIGCNDGLLLNHLKRFSPNIVGVDINEQQVQKAQSKSIKLMSATSLKFPDCSFDKVCAFEVIEHIPEIKRVFEEAYRVLKPEGKLVISFPHEFVRGQAVWYEAYKIYGSPRYARKLHVHKLRPKHIRKITRDLGFEVTYSKLHFIPFPSFIMTLKKTSGHK